MKDYHLLDLNMNKTLFQDLKKENDNLYLEGGKVDLVDDCIIFNKIKFNGFFIVKNDGFLSHCYDGFLKKITDITDETYSWDISRNDNTDDLSALKFINCEFTEEPIFSSAKFNNICFYDCIFDCRIEKIFETYAQSIITFDNCQFDSITFNQHSEEDKIKQFKLYGGKIKKLNILNNIISEKFYINKQYDGNDKTTTIDKLIIQDTIFKENFKLHNCLVYEIKIKDTDFNKNADFYKSKFKTYLSNVIEKNEDKTIYFSALNFRSLALFGECIFEERCSFKYVTFEGYSHFRGAEFKNGLDLDYTNIQKEMNFFGVTGLDSRESEDNTSQETYRILKHNFQKIGNQIEANKYHALELNVHRQNTWKILTKNNTLKQWNYNTQERLKLLSDIVPSFLHWISSKYSQSWLMPLFWILVVGWISNCWIMGWNNSFNLTEILKHVSIINLDEKLKENPVIFLFNKISLGYLYYQFINATRKHIKK